MAQSLLFKSIKQSGFPVPYGYEQEERQIEREVAYFDFQTELLLRSRCARKFRIQVFRFLEAHKCHSQSTTYDRIV